MDHLTEADAKLLAVAFFCGLSIVQGLASEPEAFLSDLPLAYLEERLIEIDMTDLIRIALVEDHPEYRERKAPSAERPSCRRESLWPRHSAEEERVEKQKLPPVVVTSVATSIA